MVRYFQSGWRSMKSPLALIVFSSAALSTYPILKPRKSDLLSSTEVTRAILETAMNPIITIDAKGHICSFNPAAERRFNIPPAKPLAVTSTYSCLRRIGKNMMVTCRVIYRKVTPALLVSGVKLTAQRKDGSIVPIHLSVGAMEDTQ